jgi:type III pantothenate kinase
MSTPYFVAADIGNARIKLGLFKGGSTATLPEPARTLPLLGKEPELDWITSWLAEEACDQEKGDNPLMCEASGGPFRHEGTVPFSPLTWWIASVNRPAATRLIDWLHENRPADHVVLLACGDLPLVVRLERPDMVGIDRLVDAVAVNRLRAASQPAVIVDVGSAITVDLVSTDGAFLGGAILPGIQMAARALHHFTDLLPLVNTSELTEPPPALGVSTESAMQAGLFWGAVGAIRALSEQLSEAANGATPDVFLTGGAGAVVAELLGRRTFFVPNLTLSGIAQIALGHETATAKCTK